MRENENFFAIGVMSFFSRFCSRKHKIKDSIAVIQ
jgi:hypothetical protein